MGLDNRMIEKDGGDNVDKNARGFITYGMLDSRERKETQLILSRDFTK